MNRYLLAAVLTLGIPAASHAEIIGSVGLTYGHNIGHNPTDGDRDTSHGTTVDGIFGYRFGGGHTLAFEALYRDDTYSPPISDGDLIEAQHQVALHYLYQFGNGLSVGAFYGMGEAPHPDANEQYEVSFGGVQVAYNTPNDITLFAQYGLVDSPNNAALSSAGYQDGYIARVGATYTGFARTAITFDLERGESDEYEDGGEPGDFVTARIGGQTSFRSNPNLKVDYGIRLARFNALNDSDIVYERTVYVGMRFEFGGSGGAGNLHQNGLIGVPYTPLRASAWTPALD